MSLTYHIRIICLFAVLMLCQSCTGNTSDNNTKGEAIQKKIIPGAENLEKYLTDIQDKNVGIVTNQTGMVKHTHLVDTLLSLGVNVLKVFSPEHGFRGTADAGEYVEDNIDKKTGLPIISLYGTNRKPRYEQLKDLDIILFDMQDVGVRFYTYISTLHYVIEACAEYGIPLIVLDRPNPNAHYIDGPVLDTTQVSSFVGMHPVPVVYGMTIGEYGKMINGEKWLKNGLHCDLTVIPIKNYNHEMFYSLPVSPSPNLPNDRSIELYPSICFFEGTVLSVGRGTEKQFQVIGHPKLKNVQNADYSFTPQPNIGAKNPVLKGKKCYGFDLSRNNSIFDISEKPALNLSFIIKTYELFPDKDNFFLKNNFFDLLAGNKILRKQIINNIPEHEIRKTWEKDIEEFRTIREKYLIY